MVRIEAVLHPEEAATVWAALDHAAKQMCREPQHPSAEGSGAVQASGDAPVTTARDDVSRNPFDRANALVAIDQLVHRPPDVSTRHGAGHATTDRVQPSRRFRCLTVRSAIGAEQGYALRVAEGRRLGSTSSTSASTRSMD